MAAAITGPSAMGSENGIPISMMLAPARSSSGSIRAVEPIEGCSPTTNGIRPRCPEARRRSKMAGIRDAMKAESMPGRSGDDVLELFEPLRQHRRAVVADQHIVLVM